MAYHYNAIAKGHNNITGLVNIEDIKPFQHFFVTVNDRNWRDGIQTSQGDGLVVPRGSPSTTWNASHLTDEQYWYLRTNILGNRLSGPVTIRTWKYAVPMITGMSEMTAYCNATLTLPPVPDGSRYNRGYTPFDWQFTKITVIEEDKMYGEIYVKGGSTSQDNIGTTAVKLTAFDAVGESDGVTASASDDSHTVVVAGKYRAKNWGRYTGTLSTVWTFAFRVDAVEGNFQVPTTTNATPDPVWYSFDGILDLSVGEVVTVYVKSDDGSSLADITVTDGAFSLEFISSL